jgi:hypothetical protein
VDQRTALPFQVRQRGHGAVDLAHQVDVDDAGELLRRRALERGDQQDAGDVHPRVQPAVLGHRPLCDPLHLVGIGHVGDLGAGLAAVGLDLLDQ